MPLQRLCWEQWLLAVGSRMNFAWCFCCTACGINQTLIHETIVSSVYVYFAHAAFLRQSVPPPSLLYHVGQTTMVSAGLKDAGYEFVNMVRTARVAFPRL